MGSRIEGVTFITWLRMMFGVVDVGLEGSDWARAGLKERGNWTGMGLLRLLFSFVGTGIDGFFCDVCTVVHVSRFSGLLSS
jgi:hypothetical protein